MRINQNKNFRFEDSLVESPVSVVGKSPCGQVDCLKELDPTLRQKVLPQKGQRSFITLPDSVRGSIDTPIRGIGERSPSKS
jgi:hypothetical protein